MSVELRTWLHKNRRQPKCGFILKHGVTCLAQKQSNEFEKPRKGLSLAEYHIELCFKYPGLTFCEGIFANPVRYHSWCVDDRNSVIDPQCGTSCHSYFGVKIKTTFLRRMILGQHIKPANWSVISEYERTMGLISEDNWKAAESSFQKA